MPRVGLVPTLFTLSLLACGAPGRTVDLYADPVAVDLGSLPVDGGVVTFEVTLANTGTGDGEITRLELVGQDLSFVSLDAIELPLTLVEGDVVRVPVSLTNLENLPEGWMEQELTLEATIDSTWGTGGCNGSAPDSDELSVPITFATPDGCDADGDGYRSVFCGGDDCDDTLDTVHPGAEEVCDFEDNDCNGVVDGEDATGAFDWFVDGDGDGYGAGAATQGCVAPDLGYVDNDTDCDDSVAEVNPGATEICNDIDDDCDERIDDADGSLDGTTGSTYWADRDGDGYGDDTAPRQACEQPIGHVDVAGDCDDSRTFVNPEGIETCDGTLDQDCDGRVDEAGAVDATVWYADRDGDLYGVTGTSLTACTQPTGYVADGGDCNDNQVAVHPNADELCNDADDDCDGAIDESAGTLYYADRDADGWGDDNDTQYSCEPVVGYVDQGGDCNDRSFRFNPGVVDPCDDPRDLNCDGAPEDGCTSCMDWLESGETADGTYTLDIDRDGDLTPDASVATYCDMTTDGGGWTLVQRTVWEWADSSQLYTGFDDWAETAAGSAAPGAAYRMPGALWDYVMRDGRLMAVHRVRTDVGGACDPLYYQAAVGGLDVDASLQSASWSGLNSPVPLTGIQLSTTDSGPAAACIAQDAVPWFHTGCCLNCPTFGGAFWNDEAHPMVSYAASVADVFGQKAADVCTDTPRAADNGSSFLGVDAMEFYVR